LDPEEPEAEASPGGQRVHHEEMIGGQPAPPGSPLLTPRKQQQHRRPPRGGGGRSEVGGGAKDEKQTLIRRMRAQRHLEDALAEGERVAVLEVAVRAAREAECSPQQIDNAQAKLELVQELEDASVSEDFVRTRHVILAATRCEEVDAQVEWAWQRMPDDTDQRLTCTLARSSEGKCEHLSRASKQTHGAPVAKKAPSSDSARAQTAVEALRKASNVDSLEAALAEAFSAGVDAALLASYQDTLKQATHAWQVLRRTLESLEAEAMRAAIEDLRCIGLGSAELADYEHCCSCLSQITALTHLPCSDVDIPATADKLRACIAEGRRLLFVQGFERCITTAESSLIRLEHRQALAKVVSKAQEVACHDASMDVLENALKQVCDAIQRSRNLGLSAVEIASADSVRRTIHSAIQDLKGAIRVFCRIRPLSDAECAAGERVAITCTNAHTVRVGEAGVQRQQVSSAGAVGKAKHTDDFDFFNACWSPGTQQEVFAQVHELLETVVDGHNLTVFAYGQTRATN